ncbi:MAG TPA: hypothetical protein VJ350_06590 [Methanoregula sp.]|nr:hypothetical protein [Methanoregula sp.]
MIITKTGLSRPPGGVAADNQGDNRIPGEENEETLQVVLVIGCLARAGGAGQFA